MPERLPQRFRYRKHGQDYWQYGVVMPGQFSWHIQAGCGHGSFDGNPWEMIGKIIGDLQEFQWLDNDYGWTGDLMSRS